MIESYQTEEYDDNRVYLRMDYKLAASALGVAFRIYFEKRGETFQKHPSYKHVANWLSNNGGRGLFMFGSCSQGKTILAKYIIPNLLSVYFHKVVCYYRMTDANRKPDDVMSHHIIALDDIGMEEQLREYGNKRNVFDEIIDAAEQKGKLVIITTNLSLKEMSERYGDRVVERIMAICYPISFCMCKHYYEGCSYMIRNEMYQDDDYCAECEHFESKSFRHN